jgi:signal transduction histidine kinase
MLRTKRRSKKETGAFQWAVWFYVVILVSSVMAFGLVTSIQLDMNRNNAIYMLGMIPFMGLVAGLCINKIIATLKLRMGKIVEGINRVAEGDVDIELELKNAGEYKPMYENFNRMVRELKNTKLEMRNFMNDFSHEFKTPITSIQGFAELLLESEVSEEERNEYLKIIAEESARLAGLSQNTLLLSKLDAQEVITDRNEFELDEQIKRCTILLFRELEKKQIRLNMELPSVKFYGNSELMCQLWINLINNAIKFTPLQGEITIIMFVVGAKIMVEISDTGIGMDEETMKHIFKKYYQGDDSHATKGFGLGLSIAKRIVELCGGDISVTSVSGRGSTFSVVLPYKGQQSYV